MTDKNDPRLTAFVLGELDQAELREIAKAIDSNPELQAAVDEIRETIELLDTAYKSEPAVVLAEEQRTALSDICDADPVDRASTKFVSNRRFYRESLFYWTLAIAAALLLMMIPLGVYEGGWNPNLEIAKYDSGIIATPNLFGEDANDYALSDRDISDLIESKTGRVATSESLFTLNEDLPQELARNAEVDLGGSLDIDSKPEKLSAGGQIVEYESQHQSIAGRPSPLGLSGGEQIETLEENLGVDEIDDQLTQLESGQNQAGFESYHFKAKENLFFDSPNQAGQQANGLPALGQRPELERQLGRQIDPTGGVQLQGQTVDRNLNLFRRPNRSADNKQTEKYRKQIEEHESRINGRERDVAQQLAFDFGKRFDPTETHEILLRRMGGKDVVVLEGDEKKVADVEALIESLVDGNKDLSGEGKIILDRLRDEFGIALAERNKEIRRKNKTWKRVKAIPNTTRLMVGDKEELELNGMQVNVQVDGYRARVLIDCFYYNHFDRQLEGKFKLRLPDDASLYYFAFGQSVYKYKQNGRLAAEEFMQGDRQFVSLRADEIARVRQDSWNNVKEARMVPREKAAHAYNQTVRRRVDPALVEWSGAGVFNASVFPLMPHKLHRVVIGYDVNLTQTDDGLVYELNLPEQTGDCRINLNVLELNGAEFSITPSVDPIHGIVRSERLGDDRLKAVREIEQERDRVLQPLGKNHPRVKAIDGQIDALMANRKQTIDDDNIARLIERQYRFDNPKSESIKLTLSTTGALMLRSDDKKEGSFWATRITPELPQVAAKANEHAVFLIDTSLSSEPDKFNVWLRLLESTLENNRDSLKKFAVVFFNVENHFWKNEYVDNNADNVAALKAHCQNLALEGATDLYAALERVNKTDWTVAGHAQPDLFLLSDGAANWGETNLQLINRLVAGENLGSLFAYQTGLTGTAISTLRFIASQSGGAVFTVASEDEIKRASTAHTQRPWRLTGIEVDGASDVMTAGRVQWVYPGQSLTLVGRVKDVDAASLGSVRLLLEQDDEQKAIDVAMDTEVQTDLANRLYGQVAVGQLESLGETVFEVATAYARHFRVTGQSCSLLMLESEADYQRFGIKPEEDLFVIKTRDAKRLVATTLENKFAEIADPKAKLISWLNRLESMPGMKFRMPTALKLAMDDIDVVAINRPLVCDDVTRESLSPEYLASLSSEKLDYARIKAESQRRLTNSDSRTANDDALKVLSSLVERNPGDLVVARDVAFAAMELHRPAQAYHLLRRVTEARPNEGSNYLALGQCLAELGLADMAMVYYEVAAGSNFQNRSEDFNKIIATEYVHLLRQVVEGKQESLIKPFAEARLQSLTEKLGVRSSDVVVTMMWNTDQTDIDLHVIEPSGEECYYQHKTTRAGGRITRDITDGFGPEMYTLDQAPNGQYEILVKYYAGNQNRTDLRNKVYLSIYRDLGRPSASVTRKTIELSEVGGKEKVDTLQVK